MSMFAGVSPAIENADAAALIIGVCRRFSAYITILQVTRSPKPLTHTGRFFDRRAKSALTTNTPAPPITGLTISSMCSGETMTGLLTTSSTVMGTSWKIAPGW